MEVISAHTYASTGIIEKNMNLYILHFEFLVAQIGDKSEISLPKIPSILNEHHDHICRQYILRG